MNKRRLTGAFFTAKFASHRVVTCPPRRQDSGTLSAEVGLSSEARASCNGQPGVGRCMGFLGSAEPGTHLPPTELRGQDEDAMAFGPENVGYCVRELAGGASLRVERQCVCGDCRHQAQPRLGRWPGRAQSGFGHR